MSKHLSVLSYTLAVIAGVCVAGGIKLNMTMRCNMKNSFVKFVIFVAGAVIGSAVTWKYAKDKYEKIADEEIASVKEMYAKKKKTEEKPAYDPVEDLSDRVKQYGYLPNEEEHKKEGGSDVKKKPYIISPDEFGENPDYETISYILYADNVLADELTDEIIDDIEGTVGEESLNHFGEYEDDSVFVRNDELGTDFEILADLRNYHDIYPDRSGEE